MNNDWFIRFRKPFMAGVGLLALSLGVPAFAEARTGSMTWRGNVDDVTRIVIRGRSITSQTISGRSPSGVSYRANGDLPIGDMDVRLQNVRGRGEVRVIQEPNRSNGFATIVEVRDRQGGAAPYEFQLFWRDDNDRGEWDRDGRWGDNDRWGNGRRDDDRWGNNGRRGNDPRNSGPWNNGRWDPDRRDDKDRWTQAERDAYRMGYDLGQRDRSRRLSRDINRHRQRFTGRTADEFRRGYNNGYDGERFPGRG